MSCKHEKFEPVTMYDSEVHKEIGVSIICSACDEELEMYRGESSNREAMMKYENSLKKASIAQILDNVSYKASDYKGSERVIKLSRVLEILSENQLI